MQDTLTIALGELKRIDVLRDMLAKREALHAASTAVIEAAGTNDERKAAYNAQAAKAKEHIRAAREALAKLDELRYMVQETGTLSDAHTAWIKARQAAMPAFQTARTLRRNLGSLMAIPEPFSSARLKVDHLPMRWEASDRLKDILETADDL